MIYQMGHKRMIGLKLGKKKTMHWPENELPIKMKKHNYCVY